MLQIKEFWGERDATVNNWIRQHKINVVDIKSNLAMNENETHHVIVVIYKVTDNKKINLNGLNK
ncbi:hypothetical protein Slash_70 [Bacillus phage Slash]|uniref:Uncharacterized protein n=2 Tax=Slashvirus TaxID=1921709 RepID=U5PWP7_9CAUD|nr:hypothetical protein Staley_72 [Bacillus phage Staley]YP_008771972.1 hypothetical protein Slash_70 [Bacillus phage Slash]AGY48359.1 hypothetical protein Slash_70 [Bacillus phage Slash]AGY48755.1 hypothetical protein Staley_72 [Bacillus phage Staley]